MTTDQIFSRWKITYWDCESANMTIQFENGIIVHVKLEDDDMNWQQSALENCSDDMEKAGYEINDDDMYITPNGVEIPTRWRPFFEVRPNMLFQYIEEFKKQNEE